MGGRAWQSAEGLFRRHLTLSDRRFFDRFEPALPNCPKLITKELRGRVVIVLDKTNADAIMRGVGENKSGVGSAITGRYLGLHDNSTASITLVDPNETIVLWASEAGDRSLMWGALARGGQRKVADRLVNNLKKALTEAK